MATQNPCAKCGRTFLKANKNQRYCTTACRKRKFDIKQDLPDNDIDSEHLELLHNLKTTLLEAIEGTKGVGQAQLTRQLLTTLEQIRELESFQRVTDTEFERIKLWWETEFEGYDIATLGTSLGNVLLERWALSRTNPSVVVPRVNYPGTVRRNIMVNPFGVPIKEVTV